MKKMKAEFDGFESTLGQGYKYSIMPAKMVYQNVVSGQLVSYNSFTGVWYGDPTDTCLRENPQYVFAQTKTCKNSTSLESERLFDRLTCAPQAARHVFLDIFQTQLYEVLLGLYIYMCNKQVYMYISDLHKKTFCHKNIFSIEMKKFSTEHIPKFRPF